MSDFDTQFAPGLVLQSYNKHMLHFTFGILMNIFIATYGQLCGNCNLFGPETPGDSFPSTFPDMEAHFWW